MRKDLWIIIILLLGLKVVNEKQYFGFTRIFSSEKGNILLNFSNIATISTDASGKSPYRHPSYCSDNIDPNAPTKFIVEGSEEPSQYLNQCVTARSVTPLVFSKRICYACSTPQSKPISTLITSHLSSNVLSGNRDPENLQNSNIGLNFSGYSDNIALNAHKQYYDENKNHSL